MLGAADYTKHESYNLMTQYGLVDWLAKNEIPIYLAPKWGEPTKTEAVPWLYCQISTLLPLAYWFFFSSLLLLLKADRQGCRTNSKLYIAFKFRC